ncbi:MAG: twin-arginine translocase subunit TatB [Betaproteobacteria bacterium]|nr:MAG: twin-arginine translocase subunit TatB [Betaproteobacteria bacterium]
MFNFGIPELMIIAVVGLIVIGPERLPRVARTLGHLVGRMQRYVSEIKADINREVELDELRKLQSSMKEAAQEIEESVSKQVNFIEDEVKQAESATRQSVEEAVKPEADVNEAEADTEERPTGSKEPQAGINLMHSLHPPDYPKDKQQELSLGDAPAKTQAPAPELSDEPVSPERASGSEGKQA